MRMWEILGIDPTHEVLAIKKAYAAKLKIHHPEDDPTGYQQLREAYDQAIKLAKRQQKQTSRSDEEPEAFETSVVREEDGSEAGDIAEHEEDELYDEDDGPQRIPRMVIWQEQGKERDDPESQAKHFMERVEELYGKFPSRINPNQWAELLNSDVVWNINLQNGISGRLLDFLEEHYFLPKEVWKLLDSAFHWNGLVAEDKESFLEQYPQVYSYAFAESYEVANMGYSLLLGAGEIDHEAYLHYREEAWLALMNNDMQAANYSLQKARELFDADPDVIRLEAEYGWRSGESERTLAMSNRLIQLCPDQVDGYLYRSRIWMQSGKMPEAVQDLQHILAQFPDHMLALSLTGTCYKKLGDLEKAKEMFQRILALDANDIEAVLALAEINALTIKELRVRREKGSGRVVRRLYGELGKVPLHKRLKNAAYFFVSHKWFSLICIVALHFWIASSFVKHTGETPLAYWSETMRPVNVMNVSSASDWELLSPRAAAVRVKLADASYMAIQEVKVKDNSGKETTKYLSLDEAKKQGLQSNITGHICMGYLDGEAILVVSNYKQAKEIYDSRRIELEGTVRPMPDELKTEIEKWKNRSSKSGISKPLSLSDNYIDATTKPSKKALPSLPWRIYFYLFILGLFYISVLRELRRVSRFFGYN
ncbi:J domain-containing protein [Paenibacillus elgii]|uniref:J domain-containing protein n=1 Tax=Paenibacillus elgii TaxID=189691 RepID=UPI002040E41E|nr:J domain-containing protein [Paenibacillus elgii]MCM3272016.1 tetratricopeptide repeat protein [Paenibacillus elgii]